MDEIAVSATRRGDERLLLLAAFCLGVIIFSAVAGSLITIYGIVTVHNDTRIVVVSACLYFVLAALANGVSLGGLLLLDEATRETCSTQILVLTIVDQLSRVFIVHVLVLRISPLVTSWRKSAALYALVIYRFGLDTLIGVTTSMAHTTLCLTLHQPILRLLEVGSDIGIDVLLCFVVHKVRTGDDDKSRIRSRKATYALLAAVIPYHLSTALEIVHVNAIVKRYLVSSLSQTLYNVALLLNLSLDEYRAPAEVNNLNIKPIDVEKREPEATNAKTSGTKFAQSAQFEEFKQPRSAPKAPLVPYLSEKQQSPLPKSGLYTIADESSPRHHSVTISARKLTQIKLPPVYQSITRNDSVASTLDHLRKTSRAKEELLLFDIDEGLITPIPLTGLPPMPGDNRQSLDSIASSAYSYPIEEYDEERRHPSTSIKSSLKTARIGRESIYPHARASQYSEIAWSAVDYGGRSGAVLHSPPPQQRSKLPTHIYETASGKLTLHKF